MISPEAERIRKQLMQSREATPPATLDEARAGLEALAAQMPLPRGMVVESVLAGTVSAEWVGVAPDATPTNTAIFHLHGGGYTMGSLATARLLASLLSLYTQTPVLSVDYRLAPEHPFPSAVEDALAAYTWLLEQGTARQRIVFAGDSAGGGLALATMVSLRDKGLPLPAGAVLISAWTDLTGSGDSAQTRASADPCLVPDLLHCEASRYAGATDLHHPLLSPLFADLSGLPPLLLHVGTDDILLDDSRRLVERAQEFRLSVTLRVWEGMWHVWHKFAPRLPEADEALQEIGAFVRSKFDDTAGASDSTI